jgi:GDSL-like Lipase/Acylhydrolase
MALLVVLQRAGTFTDGATAPIAQDRSTRSRQGSSMRKLFSTLLLTFGCWGMLAPADAHEGAGLDLSRLVVVGDSLSAGYQNGSLLDSQQVNGFASVVARQAGVPLPLPLIAAPGIPNVLTLVEPGPPPILGEMPGVSPGRVNPTVQPMNLAVPGQRVKDALTVRPDLDFSTDPLADLVLGLPGLFLGVSRSQVEWAEALAPTAAIVWLGNNDVLGPALAGDASLVTSVRDFRSAYREVLDRVTRTGAQLIVANIPDVTALPYFTSAEQVAASAGAPLEVIGPALGLAPGDFVTPDAFELIGPILAGAIPGPLPGNVVLDAGEVVTIRAAMRQFNLIIALEALSRRAALVDVHGLFQCAAARSIVVGDRRLTTDFLGGLFSLDAVHPTRTGYAVLANAFLHAIELRFGTRIPRADLVEVAEQDPLVLPSVNGAGSDATCTLWLGWAR